MPPLTYYVAIPFIPDAEGNLSPGEAVECPGANAATRKAMSLAEKHGGAIAFQRMASRTLGISKTRSFWGSSVRRRTTSVNSKNLREGRMPTEVTASVGNRPDSRALCCLREGNLSAMSTPKKVRAEYPVPLIGNRDDRRGFCRIPDDAPVTRAYGPRV